MTVRDDDEGAFVGTAGVMRDITTQKRRREKLESLVETTQELLQVRTEDAVVEATIEAASEALGFEMGTVRLYDEVTERLEPVAQVSPPGESDHERPAYEIGEFPTGEVFETGDSLLRQDITMDPDSGDANAGLYVPIGDRGTLSMGASESDAFDELDRQVVTVLATSAATALERVEREQAIRRERNRIAALFETIPEPIAHVRFEDGTPHVRTVNDAFTDVFGYAEADIVGEDLNDHIVPPDDRDSGREIDELADQREPVEREVRRLAADGERDFLFRSVPLPEQDWNDTTESIGVYVDITEQKETERELQRQNDRLERFASTVSHDLRNPLKIAKSHLDMATHECESDLLDDVAAAHDRMEELIEDLLAMARGGQSVEATEPLSLDDVARDAWKTVDTANATFEGIAGGDTEANAVFVEADRGRLLQVFENLFRNAVEHGSEDVTVRVEPTADGFAVVDDGPGIPADEHDAVFEYGYTTADTGTGLGLAIVQEVVNAHGWRVRLADTEEGARFEFET
jgi:PAS domain S-box-containing protein